MAMRRNPFQKIEEKVAKTVYTNTVVLHFNVKQKGYNSETGEFVDMNFVFSRPVVLGRIRKAREDLAAKNPILSSDLTAKLPISMLKSAIRPLPDDPVIKIDGENKFITDFRTYDEYGGLQIENDTLSYLLRESQFIQITPTHFYGNEPSFLEIVIRRI